MTIGQNNKKDAMFLDVYRALDSFFPLVALVRLTFSVGRTSTSFGRNFLFIYLIQHLINQCMLMNFYHSL